jgi:sortase (surface protein transpeptidase)
VRTLGALFVPLLAAALVACGSASVPTAISDPDLAPPVRGAAQVGALRIPAIDVDTQLVELGLTETGDHEVPPLSQPEVAGWYSLGVVPGDVGPAVLLGHVNGGGRKGIFAGLTRLEAGNEIVVVRDGAPVSFAVYDIVRVDKDEFPAERVYGNTEGPELRLVTCGGALNRVSGHYEDNIIVFARAAA